MSLLHVLSSYTPPWPVLALGVAGYALAQAARPVLSLYLHARKAKSIGLPVKLLPVPQGVFSFFAFQLARRLPQEIRLPFSTTILEVPGVKRLHAILNMGRPDGYGLHAELGDVFVTVNPAGITLVVADPAMAAYINGRRNEFPKPPNTGAIINLYGRNVINAERNDTQGDVWRLHRRVTGAAFSERIHAEVWNEAHAQASLMLQAWQRDGASSADDSFVVGDLGSDTLRLGMNVITGAAYGQKLAWNASTTASRPLNPPTDTPSQLSYRESLEEVTRHLMPLFLTPHWALRLAPRNSAWGEAWAAYEAFGGYMRGMLNTEAARMREREDKGLADDEDDNLLSALLRAQQKGPDGARPMNHEEVMGNAFIFLFAGHETTANTLHYSLLRLALHPDVQDRMLEEVDALCDEIEEGQELEYSVFERAVWCRAVMNETLRVHTPTGITNKYAPRDIAIAYGGQQHVIPKGTRIAINGTGIHFNPSVWGPDEMAWRPSRWVEYDSYDTPTSTESDPAGFPHFNSVTRSSDQYPTPPLTPMTPMNQSRSSSPTPKPPPHMLELLGTPPKPAAASLPHHSHPHFRRPPSPSSPFAFTITTDDDDKPAPRATLSKPQRGTFLPFSEGNRACSGKKFAAVEFVRVAVTLLRDWRVEILSEEEGWGAERVLKVLGGRKAGALTLQPPESVPVRFVRRHSRS